MNILKLELTNFQKHEKLVLDFTPRVNVIWGESDKGKSCIIRAISWVYFMEPKSDMRKEGSDRTSVRIIHDNGIIVERVKSDKENAYILEKDGQIERFDSIGKNVPEKIRNLLGVFPMEVDNEEVILNIAYQLKKPFLLEESATFRMKVFNKLTGNNLLDSVSQSFNKDILRIGREQKDLDSDIELKKIDVDAIKEERDRLQDILTPAETIYKELIPKIEKFNKVKDLAYKLSELEGRIEVNNKEIEDIVLPPEGWIDKFRIKVENFEKIQALHEKRLSLNFELQEVSTFIGLIKFPPEDLIASLKKSIITFEKTKELVDDRDRIDKDLDICANLLSSIKIPSGVDVLKINIDKFEKVQGLGFTMLKAEGVYKTMLQELSMVVEEIEKGSKEFKDILKQYGKCPTCHTEMTDEALDKIEL